MPRETMPFNPQNALKLVADSLELLRPIDLDRLFSTYADCARPLAEYILDHRPELLPKIAKLLADYEAELLESDPLAALQMEWEAAPLPALREAIAKYS